jgi:5'-3' exonuclease
LPPWSRGSPRAGWWPAWTRTGGRRVEGSIVEEVIPDTLTPQVPVILDVLAAFGIASVGAPGYEADDVIGSLVEREKGPVDVVTGDRDLFQLVDDARGARVLYTGRGVAKLEIMDAAAVRKRYGIRPEQYADFAVLRGDPSDGLPGVAGIGEKTAAGLLGTHGSLAAALAVLDRGGVGLAPAISRRLADAREYLRVAPKVVAVARDIELPELADALPASPRDPDALDALGERWGVASSIARLRDALPG